LPDLRKLAKQPRQRHFQLNMIVGDINPSTWPRARTRNVIRSADHASSSTASMGKLEEALAQRRFDPTQSILLAEFVR
jgi:hypothetical protein